MLTILENGSQLYYLNYNININLLYNLEFYTKLQFK